MQDETRPDLENDTIRTVEESKDPPAGKPVADRQPTMRKPVGPMTYTVIKGADVFWPGKRAAKA